MTWAQDIANELLTTTASSRTTVRLLDDDDQLHLVAEACATGTGSMSDGPGIDPRQFATYQYLERHRRLLVQDDCRTAEVAPPPSLIDRLGVLAQMLAPVVVQDRFRGTISVHHQGPPRHWTPEEIAALEAAREKAESTLEHDADDRDAHEI